MPAKKTAGKEITLTLAQAQALIDLYTNCERADTVYKACQSDLFRGLVMTSCKALSVTDAIQHLKAQI